ncbi:4'-phosphopantetheinyl transferase [Amycolatopsis antarctica]|uniref:4'-phosphopantetheinyl transferase n=2 Tax=Amycolatopsis antarctica TaxID=1854586 RepID=A0A263CWY7_9PSEU|nr:4'-phosphopantetheinyl transferase [Amycolatopsis antarctica]
MLAKRVAGERLGLAPEAVRFDATCTDCGAPHGPPRIPGAPLALSISHSGERVGVAVTGGEPVGLDVESTARRIDASLIGYALGETERAELDALPPNERGDGFFAYWTAKEAAMKATGRGLRIPLRSLTMSAPGEPPRLLASTDPALPSNAIRLARLGPGAEYRGTVAVLTSDVLDVTERWWAP